MLNLDWSKIPDNLVVTASQTFEVSDNPNIVNVGIELHDELVRRGYRENAERLFYRLNCVSFILSPDETYIVWLNRRNVK